MSVQPESEAAIARNRYGSDIDLFSRQSLLDPYADYKALRDIGPLAYMRRYDMWIATRYDAVKRILTEPETFQSGRGIGMNDTLNSAWKGFAPSLDGQDHAPLRLVMMQTIGPKAATAAQPEIEAAAERLVEEVVARKQFDAVTDLAQVLPITSVVELLGFPADMDTRRNLLHWATDAYNCCGPDGSFADTLPSMQKLYGFVVDNMARDKMRPGSVGALTYEAVDRGAITEDQALGIIGGYATAGLDTTASGIGGLMLLLAQNPDQYAILRAEPALIQGAFQEAVRVESPAQWFTRVTTREVAFDDVVLPPGTRIMHSYGAANRDERRYPEPDRFDVRRNPTDHLGFGLGVHTCMGKWLSNIEVHALMKAFVRRVERFEATAPPTRHINNLIRSLEHLPVRVHTN